MWHLDAVVYDFDLPFRYALAHQPASAGAAVHENTVRQPAHHAEGANLSECQVCADISNGGNGYGTKCKPGSRNRKDVRIPAVGVNDIEFPISQMLQQTKLPCNALPAEETAIERIRPDRNVGLQCRKQRSLVVEARSFYSEPRPVQAIGDVNELPLRATDIKIIEKL